MDLQENQGVKYLQLPAWGDLNGLVHAFSTRWGGVSPAPYNELNVSFNVGDKHKNVAENRRRLFTALGLKNNPVVKVRQVHGEQVLAVTLEVVLRSDFPVGLMSETYDALITDLKGVGLSITTADCLPLLFYDERLGVIGAAHAGWRGVAQNIAAKTIDELEMVYGCDVEDLQVALGPGIGPCCYRVDQPVLETLAAMGDFPLNAPTLTPEEPNQGGEITQWRLDMKAIVEQQLTQAGVLPKNLHAGGLCTACREDWFFSHRRDNGQTGRMMAVVMMR